MLDFQIVRFGNILWIAWSRIYSQIHKCISNSRKVFKYIFKCKSIL